MNATKQGTSVSLSTLPRIDVAMYNLTGSLLVPKSQGDFQNYLKQLPFPCNQTTPFQMKWQKGVLSHERF